MLNFAPDYVENQSVTRYLLVALNLDDVTRLDATPIRDLEALVPLRENELLNWLTVYFLSRLLQLLVVQEVKAPCGDYRGHSDENDMRVVCRFSLA